jgi:hypothetical protein
MNLTSHQAKYFAHDLTRRSPSGLDRLSMSRGDNDGGDEQSVFLYRISHPLGEHVVEGAKALPTPTARLVFDVTHHPSRVRVVEALRGKGGYLALTRLAIDSYEREEYLLFSGFDERGDSLDQETMEKLLACAGRTDAGDEIPAAVLQRLAAESQRHAQATISRSLECNSRHFNEAREKLEKWADDMVLSAEKALADTKEQVKVHQAGLPQQGQRVRPDLRERQQQPGEPESTGRHLESPADRGRFPPADV